MTISIDAAALVALISEGILYGIFLNLSVVTVHFYVTRRRQIRILAPMTVTVILMILLTTSKIAVDGHNIMVAFLNYETRTERIAYLTNFSQPLVAAKTAIQVCLPLIDNFFMTYLCYIVLSNQVWLVSIPLLITLASAVCVIGTIYSTLNPAKSPMHAQHSWMVALNVLSLAAHAIATFLTAFHIYCAERNNRLLDSSIPTYMPIIRIVVESGIMNTSYMLLVIIVFIVGSNTTTIFFGMAAPLEGIAFITVFIRAAINSQRQAVQNTTVASISVIQFRSHKMYEDGPDAINR